MNTGRTYICSVKIMDKDEIQYLVLNGKEPLIFKNLLQWDMLRWSINDWENILKDEKLAFRKGKNSYTKTPQWERTTPTVELDFKTFRETNIEENWLYYDYKYLKDNLNIDALRQNITWERFGFPTITSDDSTIWIGSKRAHTSCHLDTYGCNLVAQIYGHKLWLLFPPDEDLKPTRVPYEESSIFSKINFFSPEGCCNLNIKDCRKIILKPGDVLFVPNKWWHYVESLDLSISINTWIPLLKDNEERLKESLVQYTVSHISEDFINYDSELKLLNPNMDEIPKANFHDCLMFMKVYREYLNEYKTLEQNSLPVDCSIISQYDNVDNIPKLSFQEFLVFLNDQRTRFNQIPENEEIKPREDWEKFINACTHPDVIQLIIEKMSESD